MGPSEVKTDLTYVYRCEAKNANPAPKIQWIVNGIVTTTGVSTQTHPPPPRPSGFVPYDHPTGQSNKSVYSYSVSFKTFCFLFENTKGQKISEGNSGAFKFNVQFEKSSKSF